MSVRSSFCVVGIVALLTVPLATASRAQSRSDFQRLYARVAQLEAEVSAMRGGGSPGSAAQLELRLSALEEEIRNLTGRIEEAGYGARQVDSKLGDFREDVEFRLNRLEQATGVQAGGGAPETAAVAMAPQPAPGGPPPRGSIATPAPLGQPAPAPAPGQPQSPGVPRGVLGADNRGALDDYDHALSLLRQGEYERAEGALKGFLGTYPNDRLAGNAQYWLAETYYVRGAYDQAAQTFLNGLQTYPNSPKVADSFLKLGMSLILMGEKDRGCKVLAELPSRYPGASTAIRSRAERERQSAACS